MNPVVTWVGRGGRPGQLRLGIKDTQQIGPELRERLAATFQWLTIDRMAPGGRAIDTGLINPLTGRPMTGSTSGGPLNILNGLIDLCVGTDGGGSVLAPALATGLVGVVGTGLGLVGPNRRTSTDGFAFQPGLGVIARDFATALKGLAGLLEAADLPPVVPQFTPGLRVAVPAAGSLTLPTGADMYQELKPYLVSLGAQLVPVEMTGAGERRRALEIIEEGFAQADLIATFEGPMDLFGLGDSVLGSFGSIGAGLQAKGGKYLLKAANMKGATAVALPVAQLASGLIIQGPPGPLGAARALGVAQGLAATIQLPELFSRYFF